jgi:uncharacterized membrane protein
MDILKQLLGRLHPLVVHLPVGFIILGLLLQVYDRKQKQYTSVIALVYLWAGFSAILACITGYLQYLGEGYSFDSVKLHLWSGIATALFSFIMWARIKRFSLVDFLSKVPIFLLSLLFFGLISFTGHQGGNITHGSDYLVEPLPNSIKSALGYEVFEEKEIILTEENWETVNLYTEVVQPILNNNCVSCHNPKKTKGELLLTSANDILLGGEHGNVVVTGQPDESELYTRMVLPKEDDQHMPPDGKTQPSKEAIKLIAAWIEKDLPVDKTIGELGLNKELFRSFFPKIEKNDYPDVEIAEASIDSINLVKNTGLHVDPISESTFFLQVSAINKPGFTDADVKVLRSIAPQIAILDLGDTQITDVIFKDLATLPNLTIIKMDNTSVTGAQINQLKTLKHLVSINLSYTAFKEENLNQLSDFQSLEHIYLFNPSYSKSGSDTINDGKIVVEYGNYELPKVARDSIVY